MVLLRHASAGRRLSSPAVDRFRRLDERGRVVARQLVWALADFEFTRIVASPLPRCVESVIPLAESRGLVVESRWELEPDASAADLHILLEDLPETALVCTHRETFEKLIGPELSCELGGAWLIARTADGWVPETYVAAPSTVAAAIGSRAH